MKKILSLIIALSMIFAAASLFSVSAAALEITSVEVLTATTIRMNFNQEIKFNGEVNPAGVAIKITSIYQANWYFTSAPSSVVIGSDGKSIVADYTGATYSFVGGNFGLSEDAGWKVKDGGSVNLHDMFELANQLDAAKDPAVYSPILLLFTYEGIPNTIVTKDAGAAGTVYYAGATKDLKEDGAPLLAIDSAKILSRTKLAVTYNGKVKLGDTADPSNFVLKISDIYTANWYFTAPTAIEVSEDGYSVVLDFTGSTYSFVGESFGLKDDNGKISNGEAVNLDDMFEFSQTTPRHEANTPILMFVTNEGNQKAVLPAGKANRPIPEGNSADYFAIITENTPHDEGEEEDLPSVNSDTVDMLSVAALCAIFAASACIVIRKKH